MEKQEKIQLIKKMAIEVLQQAKEPLPTTTIYHKIHLRASKQTGLKGSTVYDRLNHLLQSDREIFSQYEAEGRGHRAFWLRCAGEYKGAVKIADKKRADVLETNKDLKEKIVQFTQGRIKEKFLQKIGNETETRDKLVNPFLEILGYDSEDPDILKAEENADFGNKKNKKIDYIAFKNTNPIILIEAKSHQVELKGCVKQIREYFANKVNNNVSIHLALLTNGIEYQFFSDFDNDNVLDTEPFFVFDLKNFNNADIAMLENFIYDKIDIGKIREQGRENKNFKVISKIIEEKIINPDKRFVEFIIRTFLPLKATSKATEKYRLAIQKAFEEILSRKNF